MDNFRRPKRQKPGGLDGFIGSRGATPPRASVSSFGRPETYRPGAGATTIGNFRQPNGFQASTQPSLTTSSASVPGFATDQLPAPRATTPGVAPPKRGRKTRKPKAKRSHSWRKIIKRSLLTFLVLALAGGSFMAVNAFLKSRKVLKGGGNAAALQKDVEPALLKGEGDGRINIMLLGKGGEGHTAPDLTDTLIIASIDPVHKEAALLSIPRDLWIKVPGNGTMKINAVYSSEKSKILAKRKYPKQQEDAENAGMDAIEKTLESSMGIPIHYHTLVDFEAFRKAIDTVGGIDIDVKERLYDVTVAWENNRNPLIAGVGQNHFNGKKALLYARSRYGSARGDFDRSQRQREIIVATKEKVLSIGTFGNPIKINELINAFGDHVQTNFARDEIKRLYDIGKEIPASKITSVGLADPPHVLVTTGNIGGISVVLPKAGAGNFKEIQSFVRNTLRDSYLKQENASIAVLNGTETAGLATAKAEDLKSYGYNVTQVADSPVKGNAKTLLVDMRNGAKKYTKHYLETRLGVTATTTLPTGVTAGAADFVIILGQNETN